MFMMIIEVKKLCRDFIYYEKESGIKGSVKNLFKRQKKIRHAVKDVSFEIGEGEIVGFIGPNGAGKSTTLKMLSGILHPTSGTALVSNYIPWERKEAFKRSFSFIAGQRSQLWGDLPAAESLYLNKCIYEIPDDDYNKTVKELTEMLNVAEFLKVQVRRLSLGERMKMELIASLLHKPTVFFLDEPTIGLDILSQQAIRDYLKEYNKKTGATIILTSHYTKDIEELCDHTIIINKGKKVYDGNIGDLRKMQSDNKVLSLTLPKIAEREEFEKYGEITSCEKNKIAIELANSKIGAVLPVILQNHDIADFSVEDLSLEKSISSIFASSDTETDETE